MMQFGELLTNTTCSDVQWAYQLGYQTGCGDTSDHERARFAEVIKERDEAKAVLDVVCRERDQARKERDDAREKVATLESKLMQADGRRFAAQKERDALIAKSEAQFLPKLDTGWLIGRLGDVQSRPAGPWRITAARKIWVDKAAIPITEVQLGTSAWHPMEQVTISDG